MLNLKPLPVFYCVNMTTLLKIKSIAAFLILYHKIMLTDINPPATSSKHSIGYSVLIWTTMIFYIGQFLMIASQILLRKKLIEELTDCCKCCCCLKSQKKVKKQDKFTVLTQKDLVQEHIEKYKRNVDTLRKATLCRRSTFIVAPIEAFRVRPPKQCTEDIFKQRNKSQQ